MKYFVMSNRIMNRQLLTPVAEDIGGYFFRRKIKIMYIKIISEENMKYIVDFRAIGEPVAEMYRKKCGGMH